MDSLLNFKLIFLLKQKVTIGKSGKKICCSCPETKQKRDECIVKNGEDKCLQYIDAHKACLRLEGFTVA